MKDTPDIDAQPARRRRGAQPGNKLALKHGGYGGEMLAFKARTRALIREVHGTLAALKAARRAAGAAGHGVPAREPGV
jgi:hypothetical protein